MKLMRVPYQDALNHTAQKARRIADFLQVDLNVDALTQQVDASL